MNEVTIRNTAITVKEYHGKRVVTFKDIDAVHERPDGTARKRFNDNRQHFIEGEDFFVRKTDEAAREFGITAPNGLVLITESGYLMLVKSFNDEFAWDVQRQIVNSYFKLREAETDFSQLSPQLQMLINIEIQQKRQEKAIREANERIDHISEIVSLDSNSWRNDSRHIVSQIALSYGGYEHTKDVYNQIYELVDKRAGVSLSTRLKNKQQRMALEGVSKSKINKITVIDIIGEDKKLIEIYLAIVKELAVKSGVSFQIADPNS